MEIGSGNFLERLSNRTRELILSAEKIAFNFGEPYLSTEHMLLALLADPTLPATSTLAQIVDLDHISADIAGRMMTSATTGERVIDLTSGAIMVLNHANTVRSGFCDPLIEPEHILVGLVLERGGLAGQVLRARAVTLAKLGRHVRMLSRERQLLRPGVQPVGDNLLRPTTGAGPANIDELLRASEHDEVQEEAGFWRKCFGRRKLD